METKTQKKLAEINFLLSKGLKTKVIAKLQGLIFAYPNELAYREKLGQVYFDLNWQEKAGQYWLLTENQTEERKRAIFAFQDSLGNSAYAILRKLKFNGNKELLPKTVQDILKVLEEESILEEGMVPNFTKTNRRAMESVDPAALRKSERQFWGCSILAVLFAIAAFLGFIQMIKALIGLF